VTIRPFALCLYGTTTLCNILQQDTVRAIAKKGDVVRGIDTIFTSEVKLCRSTSNAGIVLCHNSKDHRQQNGQVNKGRWPCHRRRCDSAGPCLRRRRRRHASSVIGGSETPNYATRSSELGKELVHVVGSVKTATDHSIFIQICIMHWLRFPQESWYTRV